MVIGLDPAAAQIGSSLLSSLSSGSPGFGYGTSIGELALMGAITGLPVGAAQAFLLRDRVANSWLWAAAMPLLWALGWTVAAAGVGVDRQYAVFGAFGAITFMALSGVLLDRLRAATPATPCAGTSPWTIWEICPNCVCWRFWPRTGKTAPCCCLRSGTNGATAPSASSQAAAM